MTEIGDIGLWLAILLGFWLTIVIVHTGHDAATRASHERAVAAFERELAAAKTQDEREVRMAARDAWLASRPTPPRKWW